MLDNLIDDSKYGRHRDHSRLENRHERFRECGSRRRTPLRGLAREIRRSKTLAACVILFILLSGCALTWLAFTLLPLVVELLSILEQQGIGGLMEVISTFGQRRETAG